MLITILILVANIIYVVCSGIVRLLSRAKPQSVPPVKNPLLRISAAALAKKIREGEISSRTVVEAYIERIREVNPVVNAVVEDRFDVAINEAKACDEKLKSGELNVTTLEREKPLYGIPVTIKETCALKGLSYTAGALLRRGIKAQEDSAAVGALKNAGAIPLCVTNVPEMCTALHCSNYLHGITMNPYDTRYTCGGSSGGEGALLGAGASLIGIGSDIAGSIRVPAHFNGVFGHKPSAGLLPNKGHMPYCDGADFNTMLVLGPLARYADDLHLAMKAIALKCEYNLRLDDPVDLRKIRVYYTDGFRNTGNTIAPTDEIKRCIRRAVCFLKESGSSVDKVPTDYLTNIFQIMAITFLSVEEYPNLMEDPNDPTTKYNVAWEMLKSLFNLSDFTKSNLFTNILTLLHKLIPLDERKQCRKKAEEMRDKFVDLLKDDGIFVLPTFPETAIRRGLTMLKLDVQVYSVFANIFGFPATHVPLGFSENGLPIGIQIVAGPRQDRLSLAVARELEKKFGGWIPPATS